MHKRMFVKRHIYECSDNDQICSAKASDSKRSPFFDVKGREFTMKENPKCHFWVSFTVGKPEEVKGLS